MDVRVSAGFAFGDELAPGVRALEVGVLCPEETALHIAVGDGFLIVKDDTLGEIAIATEKIVSCKLLTEAVTGLDASGANLEGFER